MPQDAKQACGDFYVYEPEASAHKQLTVCADVELPTIHGIHVDWTRAIIRLAARH